MDNDTLVTPPPAETRPRLPPADMPAGHAPAERQASEGNGIFRSLVADDGDIAGLVAYSIYKQNKLDWLAAFETAKGRAPDDAELASYIIGEGTPRRLATYRHLAEATLAGKGPDANGPRGPRALEAGSLTPASVATYAIILVLLLIGFWLALHYTMTSH